ncbi:uncharacterized protein LOC134264967 [Saccostrea cucullata]|uniref:uncharacterized protein LOC134264967 n=1 Tax=Saccostrea cuccullata TaxID=36930 RepID=UPI002ED3C6B9
MDVDRKREDLHKILLEQVKKNKKSQMTIAVIGPPGVGKSSFINTMIASITGEYRQWAKTGRGEGAITLRAIPVFQKKYMEFADENLQQCVFPDILDIVGFEDSDDQVTRKAIELLFYGRIPSNVLVHEFLNKMRTSGTWPVEKMYPLTAECKKIDRVIFVASAANSNLPLELCNAVRAVISKKRDIPIFGVLTGRDKRSPALENFEKFEERFKSALGISNLNYLHCTSYCDDNINKIRVVEAKNYPDLDIPVLEFLKQVLDPALESTDIIRPGRFTWIWFLEILYTTPAKFKGISASHWVLVAIVIALLVVILAILLK